MSISKHMAEVAECLGRLRAQEYHKVDIIIRDKRICSVPKKNRKKGDIGLCTVTNLDHAVGFLSKKWDTIQNLLEDAEKWGEL